MERVSYQPAALPTAVLLHQSSLLHKYNLTTSAPLYTSLVLSLLQQSSPKGLQDNSSNSVFQPHVLSWLNILINYIQVLKNGTSSGLLHRKFYCNTNSQAFQCLCYHIQIFCPQNLNLFDIWPEDGKILAERTRCP